MDRGGTISISHFDDEYKIYGMNAQRLYPNEALCRFMGRNYFKLSPEVRISTRILEIGCGSGGNLWMISKEGFDTYGLDGSDTAITLCEKHFREKWGGIPVHLSIGKFDDLPYDDQYFDAVIDVVSMQHLDLKTSKKVLGEIKRVLKFGGRFFSYRLSDGSCMYMNSGGHFEDAATIDNIFDITLPLYNNKRMTFWSPSLTRMFYEEAGLGIETIEKDIRSYSNMKMYAEYLSITAMKE